MCTWGGVCPSAASCSNNIEQVLDNTMVTALPHALAHLTLTTSPACYLSALFNCQLQAKTVYIQRSDSSVPFRPQTSGIQFRPSALLDLLWLGRRGGKNPVVDPAAAFHLSQHLYILPCSLGPLGFLFPSSLFSLLLFLLGASSGSLVSVYASSHSDAPVSFRVHNPLHSWSCFQKVSFSSVQPTLCS